MPSDFWMLKSRYKFLSHEIVKNCFQFYFCLKMHCFCLSLFFKFILYFCFSRSVFFSQFYSLVCKLKNVIIFFLYFLCSFFLFTVKLFFLVTLYYWVPLFRCFFIFLCQRNCTFFSSSSIYCFWQHLQNLTNIFFFFFSVTHFFNLHFLHIY